MKKQAFFDVVYSEIYRTNKFGKTEYQLSRRFRSQAAADNHLEQMQAMHPYTQFHVEPKTY